MKTLALILALIPAVAHADKDLEASGIHDCGTDAVVNIVNAGGTYTLTGTCTQVNINGGANTVTIDDVDELNLNGATNKITVTAVGAINVNGAKNSIKWKKAKAGKKPKVAVNGKGNSIAKIK